MDDSFAWLPSLPDFLGKNLSANQSRAERVQLAYLLRNMLPTRLKCCTDLGARSIVVSLVDAVGEVLAGAERRMANRAEVDRSSDAGVVEEVAVVVVVDDAAGAQCSRVEDAEDAVAAEVPAARGGDDAV